MNSSLDFPVSIAPMMEWTDRHYRFLMRLFTQKTILYTEMVTSDAILSGNRDKLLGQGDTSPVILQLGGSDPEKLYKASLYAKEYGYDGLNLNVGCPSDRVMNGSFGACLMAKPDLVGDCIRAMKESGLPVSVKHRIGINGKESYEDLASFVQTVREKSKCKHFIVHARIAILGGLSPSENRSIPPLRYEDVFRLKKDFSDCKIEINGGIRDWELTRKMLDDGMDGVMIGRAAYENPVMFREVDTKFSEASGMGEQALYGDDLYWKAIQDSIESYCKEWIANGGKVNHILRHAMGFFHGVKGGRKYRQFLSETMHKEPTNPYLFSEALKHIDSSYLERAA